MNSRTGLAGALITGIALASCGGGGDSGKTISRSDLGDRWPLTVESGELHCVAGGKVTIEVGGKTYAVNGLAKADSAYADIAPIWADDPSVAGLKIGIDALIDEGRKLCD